MIQTRSQSKIKCNNRIHQNTIQELEVNIDFEEASKCWQINKKSIGNGSVIYVCGYMKKNGEFCKNKNSLNFKRCHLHK